MDCVTLIIEEYESKQDPFNEAEISDRLRQLAEKQPEIKEENAFRGESLAFHFSENAGVDSYYGPFFRSQREDGFIYESPSISEVNEDILKYWQGRSQQVQHPLLRLRYSDLVWDLTKLAIGSRADIKFAREAVDQTIALCSRSTPFKFPTERQDRDSACGQLDRLIRSSLFAEPSV